MKPQDPGPMRGYQDWKVRNVPVDLARRLKAANAAAGQTSWTWWIWVAERTVAEYEARIKKGKAS